MYESDATPDQWAAIAELATIDIKNEEQQWKRQGFHMGMININAYHVQVKLNTCITLLEKLGFSQEEIRATFNEELVKQLQHDRAMLTQARLEAARPDVAVIKNPLLGPDGRPLG